MTEDYAWKDNLIQKRARWKKFNKKEQAMWDEWMNQSPEMRQMIQDLEDPASLREQLRELHHIKTGAIFDTVMEEIRKSGDVPIDLPPRPWWKRRNFYLVAAVAIVAFALGLGVSRYYHGF
jgi:hypothetical protein